MLTRAAIASAIVLGLAACGASSTPAAPSSVPRRGTTTTASPPAPPTAVPVTPTTAATTTERPAPPATPTTAVPAPPTSGAPQSVALGVGDNHRTVRVARGGSVRVDLHAPSQRWSEPQSTDQRVLTRTSGGQNAQTGEATATFSASAAGTAQIQATGGALCPPQQPCPMYAILWSVTVEVT